MHLSHPAPGRRLTSPFGPRVNPVTRRRSHHNGQDFGGTFPVLSASAGTVKVSAYNAGGFGHYVIIEHSPTLRTLYAHGVRPSIYRAGAALNAGAVVFTSGSTGRSTGPHLHFEVHERNRFGVFTPVDPAPYLRPAPPTPSPPPKLTEKEEDPMKPKVFQRTGTESTEVSVVAPWIKGADDLQRGYRILTNPADILAVERLYAQGAGTADKVNRDGYVSIQQQARLDAASWEALAK